MEKFMKIFFENISKWYNQFILLDLLTYALPGFLFLACIFLNIKDHLNKIFDYSFFEKNTFILFISIIFSYGICFVIGLSIKQSGRLIRFCRFQLLKYYRNEPYQNNKMKKRIKDFNKLQIFYNNYNKQELDKNDEIVLNWNERYMILKQMTGNFAMTIIWILSYFLLNLLLSKWLCPLQTNIVLLIIYSLLISILLFIEHHELVNDWEYWRCCKKKK